jgi:hypothetical protein
MGHLRFIHYALASVSNAVGALKPTNASTQVRSFCIRVTESTLFQNFILLVVIGSTLCTILDTYHRQSPPLLDGLNLLFLVIFVLEACLKILAKVRYVTPSGNIGHSLALLAFLSLEPDGICFTVCARAQLRLRYRCELHAGIWSNDSHHDAGCGLQGLWMGKDTYMTDWWNAIDFFTTLTSIISLEYPSVRCCSVLTRHVTHVQRISRYIVGRGCREQTHRDARGLRSHQQRSGARANLSLFRRNPSLAD